LNPVTSITITEITSTSVKGTFSGTVKASGKSDISITNGEFYVWRANYEKTSQNFLTSELHFILVYLERIIHLKNKLFCFV